MSDHRNTREVGWFFCFITVIKIMPVLAAGCKHFARVLVVLLSIAKTEQIQQVL